MMDLDDLIILDTGADGNDAIAVGDDRRWGAEVPPKIPFASLGSPWRIAAFTDLHNIFLRWKSRKEYAPSVISPRPRRSAQIRGAIPAYGLGACFLGMR